MIRLTELCIKEKPRQLFWHGFNKLSYFFVETSVTASFGLPDFSTNTL